MKIKLIRFTEMNRNLNFVHVFPPLLYILKYTKLEKCNNYFALYF